MPINKKIGLALGGGGARGLAHIGVLKVLKRERIKFDYLCGTSMGAFMGACYALGMEPEEMEAKAVASKTRDLVRLLDLAKPSLSLIKGQKIHGFITDLIGESEFSETQIPLVVVATDLGNGEEVLIDTGNIADAVQASISVPGLFPPIKIGERYLIDGGLTNPTPTDVSRHQGADLIIGVDLATMRPVKLDNPGFVTTMMQSYEIIRSQALKHKLEKYDEHTILIMPATGGLIESFNFMDIPGIIKEGEVAAEMMLPEIRMRIAKL